jgi:hypothetical protein
MEGTTDKAPQTTVIQIRIFRSGYAHPGGWMAFTAFAVGLRRPCTARVIYKGMSCITEQDASGTADHQGGVTLCATSTGMGLCRRTPRECLLQSEGPGPQTAPVAAIDRPQQKVRRFRSQTRVKMQDDGRRAVGRGAHVEKLDRVSPCWNQDTNRMRGALAGAIEILQPFSQSVHGDPDDSIALWIEP